MSLTDRRFWKVGIAALATAALATTAPIAYSQDDNLIKIDGSSTVYPITEAVAEEFQLEQNGKIKVTVGISGTGGGFKKFCAGETHISDASRPIKESEIELCKANGIEFIELPVAYDALTVVINSDNTWATEMTPDELKKLWDSESDVTTWSDIRPGWPSEEIELYGPGTDSGTFDYFSEAILGKEADSRSDYTASEDDNVLVLGVARDKNALGYFGFAYYEENKDTLRAVAIDDGDGAVLPSPETVNNGKYTPLSRPIYIYVNAKAAKTPEVKKFVTFYLENAPEFVSEVAYVPLPDEDYTKAMDRFLKSETGAKRLRDGL